MFICESCKGHSKIVVGKRNNVHVHICGERISKGLHSKVLFQSSTLILIVFSIGEHKINTSPLFDLKHVGFFIGLYI